jgi:hypothetical protein
MENLNHLLHQIQTEVSRRATQLEAIGPGQESGARITIADETRYTATEWNGPPLQWGEKLEFSRGGSGSSYLRSGWSGPEDSGVWSDQATASLEIPRFSERVDVLLEIHATPFLPVVGLQRITLIYENLAVCTWQMKEPGRFFALLPVRTAAFTESVNLTFRIGEPCSPASKGSSNDGRTLGILLHSLSATVF